MKRILLCLLVMLALVVTLAACDGGANEPEKHETETDTQTEKPTETDPPAHLHEYGEWVVVKTATCTEDGSQYKECACGDKQTEVIAKTGHTIVSHEAKAPTCTEVGWDTYESCSICGYSTYAEKARIEHTYGEWTVDKEATCTADGSKYQECSCGDKKTEVITKLGHDIVSHEAKAPTCQEKGWDAYDTCSRCDYTTYAEKGIVDCNYVYGECTVCHDRPISKGLEYGYNGDGTCYVKSWGTCTDAIVIIPEKAPTGETVTGIGAEAFRTAYHVVSITIPKTVTSIGASAFPLSRLVEIINHSSLDFEAVPNDYSYVLRYGVEVRNEESKVEIRDGYLFYPDETANYLLGYLGAETALTLPADYNGEDYEIHQFAFYEDQELVSVDMGDNVTAIGASAFESCPNLNSVMLSDKLNYIGQNAFYDCNMLGRAPYGNAYYLGSKANPYLALMKADAYETTYAINEKTRIIYREAFQFCYNIKEIVIPDSVRIIDEKAFWNCPSLTNVTGGNGVEVIGKEAFRDCGALSRVTLGNNVKKIGEKAFLACLVLRDITLPESLVSIGDYAFQGCYGLSSITIPASVTEIGITPFYTCLTLVEIINLSSLEMTAESLGRVFEAESLVTDFVEIHSGESRFDNKDGYLFYTKDGNHYLLGYVGEDTELVLPENYNGENYQIYNFAFYRNKNITSAVIPDSVTAMGQDAFGSCENLVSVTIGSGVTELSNSLFWECEKLVSVNIKGNITNIGSSAFYDCRSIEEIKFVGTVYAWKRLLPEDIRGGQSHNRDKYYKVLGFEVGTYTLICADGTFEIEPILLSN